MEKRTTGSILHFNFQIAIESPGSTIEKTGLPDSDIEKCVHEIRVFGPNNGTRFICAALLSGNGF